MYRQFVSHPRKYELYIQRRIRYAFLTESDLEYKLGFDSENHFIVQGLKLP